MRQNTIQLGSSSALPQGAGTGLGIVLLEDMYSIAYAFASYGHIRHGERPPPLAPLPTSVAQGHGKRRRGALP